MIDWLGTFCHFSMARGRGLQSRKPHSPPPSDYALGWRTVVYFLFTHLSVTDVKIIYLSRWILLEPLLPNCVMIFKDLNQKIMTQLTLIVLYNLMIPKHKQYSNDVETVICFRTVSGFRTIVHHQANIVTMFTNLIHNLTSINGKASLKAETTRMQNHYNIGFSFCFSLGQ